MKKEKCEKNHLFGICPYVTAQQLLQGKWTILILYQLSTGTKRFKELQRAIEVTQATLSTHLKQLEREGLIQRTVYSGSPAPGGIFPDYHRLGIPARPGKHP